jgi:hypothetical protein
MNINYRGVRDCGTVNNVNIPITALWDPEGSGRLRLPYSMTSALECGRLSALRTGRLYPRSILVLILRG